MTKEDIAKYSTELVTMLTYTSGALNTFQGLELGFFDVLSVDKPMTAQKLSSKMGYDISMVEKWLRFSLSFGYVSQSNHGYTLTTKGNLLSTSTPAPDLIGLHHMISYLTRTVQYAKDIYQKGVGLDSITKGKISRDYIPRVATQLSKAAAQFFKQSGLSMGHTLLDLGCGDGSVLRDTVKTCPGVSATGVDINAMTLEMGRKKNTDEGLQDQIDLQSGDVTNLSRFKDGAFDWVCAINVFHFLPTNKRETFLREMIRISRYGVFTNQVISNTLGTLAVDALLATLFTDYTGFFTQDEADDIIQKVGIKHHAFLPIIQGESRLVVLFTSKNDVPVRRISGLHTQEAEMLEKASLHTAKDILVADPATLQKAGVPAKAIREKAIQLLFP